jgi:integrase
MRPVKKGRQPAITDLEQAREVLRRADATPASPVTKLALRLLALTALRPGTLITTPWAELGDLDPETPIWQVPAARMKLRLQYKDDDERDHLVPLSTQAIDVIKALRRLTGRTPYLFPNQRHSQRFWPWSQALPCPQAPVWPMTSGTEWFVAVARAKGARSP